MVHSVSGWTRGVQEKLRDPLRTSAIPERLRGVFTTRRYTNPRLPLPYLHLMVCIQAWTNLISEDNPTPSRYSAVTLFYSGPAEDDPTASVYGERQVVAGPGTFRVTFRARERHVTDWTPLTDSTPAVVNAGPPVNNTAYWDPRLRDVSVMW